MLLRNTESSVRPSSVLMDSREDGTKAVRMAGNIQEVEKEDQTVFVYDEVVFDLEAGRNETAADILEEFEAWWEYGSQDPEPLPSLEERVTLIEEILMGGLE